MGFTNFPNGVTSLGIPQIGGGIPVTGGSYFFVDSGSTGTATGANVGTWDNPYTTLMAAYAACTASAYDVIVMKAGHAETMATDTGWALNKIGVAVVGLGRGDGRPVLTLTGTTTAATIAVSAANQTFHNFVVKIGFTEIIAIWTVSAAHVTFDAVDFVENTTAFQALSYILTTAAGDYLRVKNCDIRQVTAAIGNAPCISLVGADDVTIENNRIFWIGANNAITSGIQSVGTVALRALLKDNLLHITGGTNVIPITMLASSTGMAFNNHVFSTKTALAGSIALANLYGSQNYAENAVNKGAVLDPVVT